METKRGSLCQVLAPLIVMGSDRRLSEKRNRVRPQKCRKVVVFRPIGDGQMVDAKRHRMIAWHDIARRRDVVFVPQRNDMIVRMGDAETGHDEPYTARVQHRSTYAIK